MKNTLFILMTALLISMSAKSQINLDQGLIAHYPFCGNAIDESNNGNDGNVFGATLVDDRFGNPSGAYSFNGIDDYIDCGNNSILNSDFTGLTISSWIYLYSGGETQQQIVGKWNNSIPEDHFTVIVDNNKIRFAVANPNNSANGFIDDLVLNDSTWYQILTTWDTTGKHRIYINKNVELEVTSTQFNWISTTSNISLKIGRQINPTQHNRAFKGIIDDIRIYNRTLSQIEIDSLFNINPKQITSISDLEKNGERINISPNPASDFFSIDFPEEGEEYFVELYDLEGKLLMSKQHFFNRISNINTTHLPKGLLFVKISNEKMKITKKVVIR